ncbi:MAG TPA: hypothetical protein VMB71_05650 [Acetobacteraceae bacterium]|nr:hypothetical protein [Acetobacteraceae bacterium]
MNVPIQYLGFGCISLAAAVVWYFDYSAARRILRSEPRREILSSDEIYRRHYSDSDVAQNLIEELWKEIAFHLRLPPGALRPTDRFSKEIGAGLIVTSDLDSLYVAGRDRAKMLGRDVDFEKIKTVDDYVRVLGVR